ncbi:MAG: DNA repair protein RadC [Clostridium sp.]|nr:DNA repair protein RadC [Clostridium sp.]
MGNIKISDLPLSERPMEKLIKYGADSLGNEELLAILLRTGTKGQNVIELSTKLISNLGGLDKILDVSYEEVKKIKGIKNVKACQVMALSELFRRFNTLRSQNGLFKITRPSEVVKFLMNEMNGLKQETLKLILLDTKNNIIRSRNIFVGTLNSSLIHPREIFREAVKFGSANIIISHNHPSGNPEPSKEDINVSIRIKECGEIMGISLLDHIIIGRNNYTSLKERGII